MADPQVQERSKRGGLPHWWVPIRITVRRLEHKAGPAIASHARAFDSVQAYSGGRVLML